MLVPVRLGLRRGTMHQHTQTAAGDLPDSCVSLPLHSMPLRSRARPRCIARTLAAPASFRSTSRLLGDRQGGCSLCLPASRIDFMQSGMFRDRADRGTCRWHLRSSGWHERNGQSLRCSLLRRCASGRWPCFISQPQEPLCSLSPQHRHPLSQDPRCRVPAVSRLHPPIHPTARWSDT